MYQKPPKPIRDKKHLQFVAGLPCCVCGACDGTVVAHHLKTGEGGMGMKAGDDKTIPLCFGCHTGPKGVHLDGPEPDWMDARGIDGKALAKALYAANMDTDKAFDAIGGIK